MYGYVELCRQLNMKDNNNNTYRDTEGRYLVPSSSPSPSTPCNKETRDHKKPLLVGGKAREGRPVSSLAEISRAS